MLDKATLFEIIRFLTQLATFLTAAFGCWRACQAKKRSDKIHAKLHKIQPD
jgi:hypothetical protein